MFPKILFEHSYSVINLSVNLNTNKPNRNEAWRHFLWTVPKDVDWLNRLSIWSIGTLRDAKWSNGLTNLHLYGAVQRLFFTSTTGKYPRIQEFSIQYPRILSCVSQFSCVSHCCSTINIRNVLGATFILVIFLPHHLQFICDLSQKLSVF